MTNTINLVLDVIHCWFVALIKSVSQFFCIILPPITNFICFLLVVFLVIDGLLLALSVVVWAQVLDLGIVGILRLHPLLQIDIWLLLAENLLLGNIRIVIEGLLLLHWLVLLIRNKLLNLPRTLVIHSLADFHGRDELSEMLLPQNFMTCWKGLAIKTGSLNFSKTSYVSE